MATWSTRITGTTGLVIFILLSATFGDAAITWRRVTKPISKPQASASETTYASRLIIKSPVTWKRSSIVRRSIDDAESESDEDGSDEMNGESSEKEEDLKELESDSEIRPLVPGSRPGFWFDSSRRKKPASLLRPGARRNSLFPTRSSTTTTSTTATPTTVKVTPVTAVPRTPPPELNHNAKNEKTKTFGSNTSTNSPVTFRRRLKTTGKPKLSSTTESFEFGGKKNTPLTDTRDHPENERKEPNKNESENNDITPTRPKFNSRRRYYNGTRLSWIKQSNLKSSRTTAPQQLTTTPPIQDLVKISRTTTKLARTRSKVRTSTPHVDSSRTKPTTIKPTVATAITSKQIPQDVTSTRKNPNKKNAISEPHIEKEKGDFDEQTTLSPENHPEPRQTSPEKYNPKLRTTVEPFFITKDYGRIVTVTPEITKNIEERVTTVDSRRTEKKEYVAPTIRKDNEHIAFALPEHRNENERRNLKTTEAPAVTTATTERSEKENQHESEDMSTSAKYIDDFKWKYTTTTENPKSTKVKILEKEFGIKTSSTIRPVTLSAVPTVDPKSNAYVVWSVGHGGSGWSYQKHGGKVQWSAQNSEAEGDSWSVVANDEKVNIPTPTNQWVPIVNSAPNYKQPEKLSSNTKDKSTHSTKRKPDVHKINSSVTDITKSSFKNETILNSAKTTDAERLPNQVENNSLSKFSTPSGYASDVPTNSGNSLSLVGNLPQTIDRVQKVSSFVSETQSPTEKDKFNAQVNRYPTAPDYPYIAEIRETYRIPTYSKNAPTTKLHAQGYVTETTDANREKESQTSSSISTKQQQSVQDSENNPHPTALSPIETVSPYIGLLDKGIPSVNKPPATKTASQSSQSRIPPELSEAVANEKKWHVVGSGGDEGWSLYNENGVLEWKIHNVHGEWKVSSADQLLETQAPYTAHNQESETENYNFQQHPPKVWKLEDDYEKWRTVSSERGIPVDEPFQERTTSTQEYDYGGAQYNGDYYSNDDYSNSGPIHPPYQPNEEYGDRSLWKMGENRMSDGHSEYYPQFSGNIETANSRQDAIAAWKSLMAQQRQWKLSNRASESLSADLSQHPRYIQHRVTTASNKVSTTSPRHGNDHKSQNGNHEATGEQYESQLENNPGGYQDNGNDQGNDKLKASKIPALNLKLYEARTVPKSAEQVSGHHGRTHPGETHFQNARREDVQIQEKNKSPNKEGGKLPKHPSNQKYDFSTRDQPQIVLHAISRLDNERKETNSNVRERNQKFNSEREKNVEEQEHSQANIQSHEKLRVRNFQKNNEKLLDAPTHMIGKDFPKLESLINKLEAIQGQSKGRAILDLTEFLKQIKARRNVTSSTSSQHPKHQPRRIANPHISSTLEIPAGPDIHTLSTTTKTGLPETFRKDVYYGPNMNLPDNTYDRTNLQNDYSNNREATTTDSKIPNHLLRHSNRSNRNKSSTEVESPRTKIPSNSQIELKNARIYSSQSTKEQFSERYSASERPQTGISEESMADVREDKNKKLTVSRRQRKRKQPQRPHYPKPIVMEGETEVEDEENGTKQNRKIIVIDYAARQKSKSPSVGKKDLELIIRNIRHRRSEMYEDNGEINLNVDL